MCFFRNFGGNSNGIVTVNQAGYYQIETKVQADNGSAYCIYIKGALASGFIGVQIDS